MSRVVASSPGKVVLFGEYVVLDGAPALAMAVDCRALASIVAVAGDISTVTAAGYSDDVGRFRITGEGLHWMPGGRAFNVVSQAWRAAQMSAATAMRIELDSTRFVNAKTGQKIGLGSSAAVTVALCAALRRTADRRELAPLAYTAHTELQDGAGSGVDVACSLNGGLIEYRMQGNTVSPRTWPDGLHYRLLNSGVGVSTRQQLSKLDAVARQSSRDRLAAAAEKMAAVWSTGDANTILAEAKGYGDILRSFSEEHALGIYAAGHDDLWRIASGTGLFYKPCGAGGGDVGVVMGVDVSSLERFVQNLPANFSVLGERSIGDKSSGDLSSAEGVMIKITEQR